MSGQPNYPGEPQTRDEALYFARMLGVIAERPPRSPLVAKLHDLLVTVNPNTLGPILQQDEINDGNKIREFIRFELDCSDDVEAMSYGEVAEILSEEYEDRRRKVAPGHALTGVVEAQLNETPPEGRMRLERLQELKHSHRVAYLQRKYAQTYAPNPEPDQPGDKAAHEWLMQHGNEDGETPVALETWIRYLRAARRVFREHTPRRGRERGGSMAYQRQL